VMTRREWDATGVARLRPDERAALEAWVQKYRDNVRQTAASRAGAVSNGDVASTPQPAVPPTGYFSSYAAPVAPPAAAPSYAAPAAPPAYPTTPQPSYPSAPPQYTTAPQYAPAPVPPPSYPSATQPAPQSAPPLAAAGAVIKTGLSVQDIRGGNRFVSLSDGSMWDVYAADRGETSVWRIQDPVYVRTATTPVSGGYDREIVNASRNVLIRVKYVGEVGN